MSTWKKMSATAQREAQVRMANAIIYENQKNTQNNIESHT